MSEVRLNVLDKHRSISGTVHGGVADAAIAALSADPETIQELQDAVAQFIKPGDSPLFALFTSGTDAEPWDAGIVFIDLAARAVAGESTWSIPEPQGRVSYHDGRQATKVSLPYVVSDDWLFVDSIEEYLAVRDQRRAERAAAPPLDARAVLYGAPVLEFIATQCLAARHSKAENPIPDIHARWLMTPRDDLRGQSPRDLLLATVDFIDADLQCREAHWSFLKEPAPCLGRDSMAYRFAGFGTHEFIMYYELLRFLLSDCLERVTGEKELEVGAETARLECVKAEWLERAQPDLGGRSPGYIIECERRRLPLLMTAEEWEEEDDDEEECPLCTMMEEQMTPMFCHFAGSNLDDDFPFSFHTSRADWEAEHLEREEFLEEMRRKYGPPPSGSPALA